MILNVYVIFSFTKITINMIYQTKGSMLFQITH